MNEKVVKTYTFTVKELLERIGLKEDFRELKVLTDFSEDTCRKLTDKIKIETEGYIK